MQDNPDGRPIVQRKIVHESSEIVHGIHKITLEKSNHGVTITYRDIHVTLPNGPAGAAAVEELASMYNVRHLANPLAAVKNPQPPRTYKSRATPPGAKTPSGRQPRATPEEMEERKAKMTPSQLESYERSVAKKFAYNRKSTAKKKWLADGRPLADFESHWKLLNPGDNTNVNLQSAAAGASNGGGGMQSVPKAGVKIIKAIPAHVYPPSAGSGQQLGPGSRG